MSKENQPNDNSNQYFPSFNSAYSYYQHQNKLLQQRKEELKNELLITQKLWSAFPNADEYIATKRPLEPRPEMDQTNPPLPPGPMNPNNPNNTNMFNTMNNTNQIHSLSNPISQNNLQLNSHPKQTLLVCKPPEIRLSTAKVFRYRPFSIILTMSSTWRESKGLSYEQVFRAVNALKCKKEGENEEFATCVQCSGKNIIEIGSSNGTNYEPTVSDDKTEMYIFDHCKTNCSSSRNHHKKKLQIVITLGDEKIITVPFSIQAREKKTTKGKGIPMNANPNSARILQNQNQMNGTNALNNVNNNVSGNNLNGGNNNNLNNNNNDNIINPLNTPNTQNIANNTQNETNKNQSITPNPLGNGISQGMGISNLSSIPPSNIQTQNFNYQNTFNQMTSQQNSGSNERVAVFVFSTCLEPSETIMLINDYSKYVSSIQGYINIRVSFLEGLFFVFTYFTDVAHAEECISMTKGYVNNDPSTPNLYKKKLADDNIAILMTTFYNWNEQGSNTLFPQPF